MTVSPVLYLSNGSKYDLPDVKLEPAGTAVIDLNDSLRLLGIAPWATLSGYVEVLYSWPWDPICATIHNVDTAHSLISVIPSSHLTSSISRVKPQRPQLRQQQSSMVFGGSRKPT